MSIPKLFFFSFPILSSKLFLTSVTLFFSTIVLFCMPDAAEMTVMLITRNYPGMDKLRMLYVNKQAVKNIYVGKQASIRL